MPFRSKAQAGAAFGGHIPGFSKTKAHEWAHETPGGIKSLPKYAHSHKDKHLNNGAEHGGPGPTTTLFKPSNTYGPSYHYGQPGPQDYSSHLAPDRGPGTPHDLLRPTLHSLTRPNLDSQHDRPFARLRSVLSSKGVR